MIKEIFNRVEEISLLWHECATLENFYNKEVKTQLYSHIESLLNDLSIDCGNDFFEKLDEILNFEITKIAYDIDITFNRDPAANTKQEVILAYPGIRAIVSHRLAHSIYKVGHKVLARLISEHVHGLTGIDIHPGASIDRALFIDHGTGIVVGESTTIYENVSIYHGVTLGAIVVEKIFSGVKRHPTIESNVIVYSNTSILGGETTIGANSIIGGNLIITRSVNRNTFIYLNSDNELVQKPNKAGADIKYFI